MGKILEAPITFYLSLGNSNKKIDQIPMQNKIYFDANTELCLFEELRY